MKANDGGGLFNYECLRTVPPYELIAPIPGIDESGITSETCHVYCRSLVELILHVFWRHVWTL